MATLILLQDDSSGVRFHIDKPNVTIGRGPENDISLDDELVSKAHAVIEVVVHEKKEIELEYLVHDLDSTNHTFVNDEMVGIRRLAHDDMVRIGKSVFRFVDDANDKLDVTTKLHKTWIPGIYFTRKNKKKK